MVIYFADRRMNILGMASTELREGFTVGDDLKSEDTDTGVATFECTIPWDDDTRALIEACTAAGNYILRSYKNENEFYTIVETEVDTKAQTVNIYAEDAGMDLLNETVGAYSASSAHPIAWYVEMYAEDTGFEVGINEIEDLSRTLSWEGEATAAERIASVATQFDNAEISYSFEIKGLEITHKYINIHKKRGQDAGVQLRLNRDVDRIITTTSVADLATALYVTGGTPEEGDEPITIEGYEYDDGDMYVMEGAPILCSRSALAEWSRYVWAKEPNQIEGYTGNIVKQWSYDTTSQSELCNRAITQLKKVCEPAVNYEIDITTLPDNVGIGDYVDIVDEKGELYLSSRILKLTTSVCNQKQTATLGEFLIQDSGISETVRELAEQFSQLAKSRQYYVWIVYADDEYGNGISLDPEGKTYMGTCTTTAGATPDISDPSIYKWSLIQGDGGVGIETINTYYGVSESPYDVPTEWTTTPPDVLRDEYTWSYTEYIYTDGTVEQTSPHIVAYYDYLEVDELDARVANIADLLAGTAGVGDLQAIHLTADNVVIDDAVIFDLIATNAIIGDLLAGTICTDYITITSEDGSYTTKGATTQYCDADGNVRIQIGLDESGNFTFVLYGAEGEGILIDETGIKASAISDGLIVNDMVADDAAISGSKLDIVSVTEYLNEYGGITLEAAQVTIDGTTLDYKLDTITEATNRAVTDTYTEYYQSDSPTELTGGSWSGEQPQWKEDKYIWARTTTTYGDGSVITGAAVCITGNGADGKGIESIVAYYAVNGSGTEAPEQGTGIWSQEIPTPADNEYLWMAYLVTYTDGTQEWTGVACLTDESTRSRMTVLETELEVVQGQLSAKVSSSEVYQIVNDVIDNGLDVNALTPRNYCLLSGGYKESDDPTAIITFYNAVNWDYFDVTANDGYIRILNLKGNYNNPYFWLGLSNELELETEYTVTAVLRGNVGYNYFYAVYTDSSGGQYPQAIATDLYFGTEWTTVSFRWTPSEISGYVISGIGSWGWGSAGYYMDIKSIMVEKGDTSHDWVRAPEDYAITSDITAINDKYAEITVTLDEITSEVKELTTISTDNSLLLIEHDTRITQNENDITLEASRAMAAEPKYGTCSTSASTKAKTVSCSDFTSLTTGVTICVYFTYGNTASSPTLNVNSTGAKTIYAYGASIASGSDYNWEAKSYVTFVYNGSQWCMVDAASLYKIAQLQVGVTELGEDIDFIADDLKGNIISYINGSADVINFTSTLQLTISSPYFTLDENGHMWAAEGTFSGEITAESGYIGNWIIDSSSIYRRSAYSSGTAATVYEGAMRSPDTINSGTYFLRQGVCEWNGSSFGDWSFPFYVTYSGHMVSTNATITGSITANDGNIGGFTIDSAIFNGKSSLSSSSSGIYIGTDGISLGGRLINTAWGIDIPLLNLTPDGELYAYYAYIGNKLYMYSAADREWEAIIVVDEDPEGGNGTNLYIDQIYKLSAITCGDSLDITCGDSLDINAEVYIRPPTGGYLHLYNSYGDMSLGTSSSSNMGLYDYGNSRWIVHRDSSYRTILGNSNMATIIYGNGVYLNGTSTAVTSDRQIKADIEPLESNRMDDLSDKLTPRIYTVKDDPETKHIGFVVDEVEEAMRAAGYDPDDFGITTRYKDEDGTDLGAIRYDEFIPILLYEIQQLKAQVKELQAPA